jgi:hypothetical protein
MDIFDSQVIRGFVSPSAKECKLTSGTKSPSGIVKGLSKKNFNLANNNFNLKLIMESMSELMLKSKDQLPKHLMII